MIELDAEKRETRADPVSDLGRPLPDAGGEHKRIEAAERGCHRGHRAGDAMDVHGEGEPRAGVALGLGGEELPDVARAPREAGEARLVLERVVEIGDGKVPLAQKVEERPGKRS